jgi:hypothetical protein
MRVVYPAVEQFSVLPAPIVFNISGTKNHNQLTPSWELSYLWTSKYLTEPEVHYRVHTRALHWSLPWATWIQSTAPHPISTRSILILSTHLRHNYFLWMETACGSVVGWGTMLQNVRSRVPFLMRSVYFFYSPSFTPIQNHRQNYSFVYSNFFMFLDSRREDKMFWAEW